jgi:hypothetical protein
LGTRWARHCSMSGITPLAGRGCCGRVRVSGFRVKELEGLAGATEWWHYSVRR